MRRRTYIRPSTTHHVRRQLVVHGQFTERSPRGRRDNSRRTRGRLNVYAEGKASSLTRAAFGRNNATQRGTPPITTAIDTGILSDVKNKFSYRNSGSTGIPINRVSFHVVFGLPRGIFPIGSGPSLLSKVDFDSPLHVPLSAVFLSQSFPSRFSIIYCFRLSVFRSSPLSCYIVSYRPKISRDIFLTLVLFRNYEASQFQTT